MNEESRRNHQDCLWLIGAKMKLFDCWSIPGESENGTGTEKSAASRPANALDTKNVVYAINPFVVSQPGEILVH
jgi:hypothetical protein